MLARFLRVLIFFGDTTHSHSSFLTVFYAATGYLPAEKARDLRT